MLVGDRWRVDDLSESIWLVRRSPWGADLPRGAAPLGIETAIRRLGAWFPEGWGSTDARLAAIASSLLGDTVASGTHDPGWLRRVVKQALHDGRLTAVRVTPPPTPGSLHAEEEEEPAERPAPREEKTWVEIILMDDDTPPKPVPFKRYRVELPDRSTREGMLDEHGRAMILDVDPGTCQVSFPGLETRHS